MYLRTMDDTDSNLDELQQLVDEELAKIKRDKELLRLAEIKLDNAAEEALKEHRKKLGKE